MSPRSVAICHPELAALCDELEQLMKASDLALCEYVRLRAEASAQGDNQPLHHLADKAERASERAGNALYKVLRPALPALLAAVREVPGLALADDSPQMPHSDPSDCPTWHDWCHCSVEALELSIDAHEAIAAERDRLLAREARAARIEAVVTLVIGERTCMITHCGHPDGWTCLDTEEHARTEPGRFSDEFRAAVLRGDFRCYVCTLRAALACGATIAPV